MTVVQINEQSLMIAVIDSFYGRGPAELILGSVSDDILVCEEDAIARILKPVEDLEMKSANDCAISIYQNGLACRIIHAEKILHQEESGDFSNRCRLIIFLWE